MTDKAGRILGLAIIGTCIGTIVATAALITMSSSSGIAEPTPSYSPGEVVDVPAAVYDSSDRTLLIFARNGCAACQRSKDLLRRLAAAVSIRSGAEVRFVSGLSPAESDERSFAEAIGLEPSQVWLLDLPSLRLGVVPTLMVVDRRGTVLMVKEGAPQESDLQGVLAAIPSILAME